MFGVNADFRYSGGHPSIAEALRHGIGWVRVTSLPEMEEQAALYLSAGIRVLGIYTGESDRAGHYVMRNLSALQIGNEPFTNGEASWPTGNADDFVNVWSHVADVLVPATYGALDLPLVGPGIWSQDYARWREIAKRLPGLTAAAVHVYPDPSGHTLTAIKSYLRSYQAVRPDLPLICTEWTDRRPDTLATARAIDAYCSQRFWFTWGPGVPGHDLASTPELGVLAMA